MISATSPTIKSFHAHVYFSPAQYEQAQALCTQAGQLFALKVGRFHPNPVGPHPTGMCQLTVECAIIGEVLAWLALNRNGLVIFTHPETGQDLKDHTEHAIWMGEIMALNLAIFA